MRSKCFIKNLFLEWELLAMIEKFMALPLSLSLSRSLPLRDFIFEFG
jgi:hypothetical protein